MFWNCIFYISLMYEFLHSQGHKRTYASQQAVFALPVKTDIRHDFWNAR